MNPPDWLTFGSEWITTLQASGPAWLTLVMDGFTWLGSEWFYLLVMPAVLWSYDSRLGIRLGVMLLLSGTVNSVLKLAFGLPRPFWIDSRIRALSPEGSFGLPSGHAQNGVALWGLLAYDARRPWAWVSAALLILGISFSRVYLGVHFPADVAGGWLVGAGLLLLVIGLGARLSGWYSRVALRTRVLAAGLLALALLAIGGLVWRAVEARPLPQEWQENYEAAAGASVFAPAAPDGILLAGGALFGFALGAVLLDSWDGFDGRRRGWTQGARYLIGVIGLLVLYLGLRQVLPEGEVFRYLRYAAVGFWISYGAPRAFGALRIA